MPNKKSLAGTGLALTAAALIVYLAAFVAFNPASFTFESLADLQPIQTSDGRLVANHPLPGFILLAVTAITLLITGLRITRLPIESDPPTQHEPISQANPNATPPANSHSNANTLPHTASSTARPSFVFTPIACTPINTLADHIQPGIRYLITHADDAFNAMPHEMMLHLFNQLASDGTANPTLPTAGVHHASHNAHAA